LGFKKNRCFFGNLYKSNTVLTATMEPQDTKKNKVKRFIKETIRVIRITKKPNKTEYISSMKVTGLGIAIIGAIGFVIFLGKQILF